MDQKKLKIAYHETGHAVMALICHQGIKRVSLREMDSPRGTDKYLKDCDWCQIIGWRIRYHFCHRASVCCR